MNRYVSDRSLWWSLGFFVVALMGCQAPALSGDAGRWPVQWNPKLHISVQGDAEKLVAQRWEEPLPVARFVKGVSPERQQAEMVDCLSYFELTRLGYQSSPVRDQQQEGARCHALRAIGQAVPAQRSFLTVPPFTERIVEILPPDIGVIISEDDRRRLHEVKALGLSLAEATSNVRVRPRGRGAVLIEGPEWGVRVEFYARGDFNGDGIEDLLVKTTGWMTEGSYQAIRLLLLTQTEEEGHLKLIKEYPLA